MAESLVGLNEEILASKNTAVETIIRRQTYVIISILLPLNKIYFFPIEYWRYVRKVVKYILTANPKTAEREWNSNYSRYSA